MENVWFSKSSILSLKDAGTIVDGLVQLFTKPKLPINIPLLHGQVRESH